MADSSFDVVSKVDLAEAANAIDQAMREIKQRYDFRGSISKIELNQKESKITLTSDDEFKLKSVIDVLQGKLVKRSISLKALVYGKVEKASGGTVRQDISLQQGIPQEKAREIVKLIKDRKMKVQAQIQADQVRISAKKKDDLQTIIAALKEKDFGLPLQFTNYR
jgi:hypothetical protein